MMRDSSEIASPHNQAPEKFGVFQHQLLDLWETNGDRSSGFPKRGGHGGHGLAAVKKCGWKRVSFTGFEVTVWVTT